MLSQSDIKAIDLAYTHANSVKKKTALEVVFISLYSKYKMGDSLSKIEYRIIKDYLAVYRSEFAMLKKKAKLQTDIDKNEATKRAKELNYYKKKGVLMNEAMTKFANDAKQLRIRKQPNLVEIHNIFLFCLGYLSFKDSVYALKGKGLQYAVLQDKKSFLLIKDYGKITLRVNFALKKFDEIFVIIPQILCLVNSELSSVYMCNFTTRKSVILAMVDRLRSKDEIVEKIKNHYEICSDDLLFLDNEKILSSVPNGIDKNLIKIFEL